MKNNEALIQKQMKLLGISREEAIQLIADDNEVDKMTSVKKINSDLSIEQVKASKSNRKTTSSKTTVYKFDTTKKVRKENTGKRFLIDTLKTSLEAVGCANIDVTNPEREMIFESDGIKYKIVLSQPRK